MPVLAFVQVPSRGVQRSGRTLTTAITGSQEEEEEDTKRFLELTEGLAVERSEHKQTLAAKDRKILVRPKRVFGGWRLVMRDG